MLSIVPKISNISVRIQMERSVAVSSNWNIADHLLRWSTLFRLAYSAQNSPFHFLTNQFFALVREFGKGIKMARAIPIGWPSLIEKCCSIFLRYACWSLTSRFGIIESTHGFYYSMTLVSCKNSLYCNNNST